MGISNVTFGKSVGLLLLIPCVGTAETVSCAHLLIRDNTAVEKVVESLADLRRVIQATKSPALRARLEEDFQQKLQQLSGHDSQKRGEVSAELRLRLRKSEAPQFGLKARDEIIDQQARILVDSPVKLRTALQTEIQSGRVTVRDASTWSSSTETRSGVVWSEDESYVAIRLRPFSIEGPLEPVQIYHVPTQTRLDFAPRTGQMTSRGTGWAQDIGDEVVVFDFVTGALRGKAPGRMDPSLGPSSADSVFSRQGDESFWTHFDVGTFKIGKAFGVCQQSGTLAFVDEGRVRVLDIKTGQYRLIPQLENVEASGALLSTDGFLMFKEAGQSKILFLDDETIVDLSPHVPEGIKSVNHIPGSRQIYFYNPNPPAGTQGTLGIDQVVDLTSGRRLTLSPAVQRALPGRLIARARQTEDWYVIDPKDGSKAMPVPGRFTELLLDRWLVKRESTDPGFRYRIFDLHNNKNWDLRFAGHMSPVPGSDLWTFMQADGSFSWVSDLDHPENKSAALGRELWAYAGASPSGQYLVGDRDGRIVIFSRD